MLECRRRAINNYRSKFDYYQIKLDKGEKEVIKEQAAKRGFEDLNSYLVHLIRTDRKKIEADS